MRVVVLLLTIFVTAASGCTRGLSGSETAFLRQLTGDSVDVSRLRIHPGLPTMSRKSPISKRLTCVSRLYPPQTNPNRRSSSPGMTLWNTVLIRSDWHAKSMVGDWPRQLDLPRALLLTHEALHVWQWQQRAKTGYTPFKAFGEHFASADPYLFDTNTKAEFAAFGYEQQGAIIEEYLCCRLLAPKAERTERLHAMLSRELPLSPLDKPLAQSVRLPWKGVQIDGICDG